VSGQRTAAPTDGGIIRQDRLSCQRRAARGRRAWHGLGRGNGALVLQGGHEHRPGCLPLAAGPAANRTTACPPDIGHTPEEEQ
jgi:hypothetical protein